MTKTNHEPYTNSSQHDSKHIGAVERLPSALHELVIALKEDPDGSPSV